MTLTMEASIIELGKKKASLEGRSLSQLIGRLIVKYRPVIAEESKPHVPQQQPQQPEQPEPDYDEPVPIHFGD